MVLFLILSLVLMTFFMHDGLDHWQLISPALLPSGRNFIEDLYFFSYGVQGLFSTLLTVGCGFIGLFVRLKIWIDICIWFLLIRNKGSLNNL